VTLRFRGGSWRGWGINLNQGPMMGTRDGWKFPIWAIHLLDWGSQRDGNKRGWLG